MLQATVARLAGNSFTIKGWSVTLVSALLAFAVKELDWHLAALSILPLVLFWGLDAYYLRQERLFRHLYETVRTKVLSNDPSGPALFSMNADQQKAHVGSLRQVAFDGPILAFHGSLALLILLGVIIGLHGVHAQEIRTGSNFSVAMGKSVAS